MWFFRADIFRRICHGRGPRRWEDFPVLDRECELEVLAPVVEIDGRWMGESIFF
jgi:hypothetical protein